MRGATGITLQPHQILRLPRKIALQNQRKICRKQLKRHFQCAADSSMIRPWSEHDPTMKLQNWTRPFAELTFPPSATHFVLKITTFRAPAIYPDFTEYCACHKKWRSKITKYCACHATWLSWLMSVTHNTSFTMRGATSITLQPHQMLPLPRKMMRIIDCRRIWNVIYNARSNRNHPPTSPNTAPATQNCTPKSKKNLPKTVEASFPMRGRFEHDPTMIRPWNCKTEPVRSQSLLFPPRQRILYWKLQHFALRLSTQISPNTAPATKSDAPRSPNTAPATQHDSHDWCPSPMTRHLQCAEQQASPSNLTKCCPCHEKWCASLIVVAYETSFTMRGATGIALQPHQILRLPRKMTLMIDLRHIWNVIYNARSNRHHPPTSPNTAPATQKCTPKSKRNSPRTVEAPIPMRGRFDHDPNMIRTWSEHELVISHPPVRRGYFSRFGDAFCIENYNISRSGYLLKFHRILRLPRKWHSDITKYCACHEKWCASLIVVAYETSFTMRGATGIALQPHQILRLPRKMALMIDLRNIWNVIYNARSNRHHPPTSPNTAPATQKCTPKSKRNSPRTVEAPIPMRGRFDHDPNMIRTWSEHELVISHPPVRRGYFSRFGDAFCIENYNISRSGYLLKFHRILRLPRKVTLRHHQILRLPRKVTLRHHQMLRLPRKVTLRHHQILRLPRKVTLRHHQILRLPRKVRLLLNCYWTELLLSCYWAVTKLLLSCYWTVTELLLTLNWPVTELLLRCYWTELLLNWTVTGLSLNCYWTDLLLNWAVTQLLLDCYWTVTELTCYWTELLLNCYWTVTELTCYSAVTELLLCTATWTVTVLDSLHF